MKSKRASHLVVQASTVSPLSAARRASTSLVTMFMRVSCWPRETATRAARTRTHFISTAPAPQPQQQQQPPVKHLKMKCVLVLAALVAVSLGQHDTLMNMVTNEVDALLAADSGLTVDACTTKCDALFDFIDSGDESTTDQMCADACKCKIDNTCNNNVHHGGHVDHHLDHTPHPHP
ncbi:hypothetical protein EGW08_006896 [Elysia chlorotica]|uniref:Uncharacterized protein n=1 Tax=Elysia chlorotica TaxID=188477 RepID=A0A433TUV8_ELYCH|nr:hypothetical protein EGW08_006896 [Elysia chlorotica]